MTGEANQSESNGVPDRRKKPKQCPERTIVSSILADLILWRIHRRRTALSGPTVVQHDFALCSALGSETVSLLKPSGRWGCNETKCFPLALLLQYQQA